MGYIYKDTSTDIKRVVGKVEYDGYIYRGPYKPGQWWDPKLCVGKVENGYVYGGGYKGSYSTSYCLGMVDGDGYIYKGPYRAGGYDISYCVGRVEKDGYVYAGGYKPLHSSYSMSSCIGRVDTDGMCFAAGAALLLLLQNEVPRPAQNNNTTTSNIKNTSQSVSDSSSNWFQTSNNVPVSNNSHETESLSDSDTGSWWDVIVGLGYFLRFIFLLFPGAFVFCIIGELFPTNIEPPKILLFIAFVVPSYGVHYLIKGLFGKADPEEKKPLWRNPKELIILGVLIVIGLYYAFNISF